MNCTVCGEVITNPLSAARLHEGVTDWLRDEGREDLVEVTRPAPDFAIESDTTCIKSGRPMSLCTYCYTGDVMALIREDPKLLERFLTYFNFDLEHLGWEQEARAYLGG